MEELNDLDITIYPTIDLDEPNNKVDSAIAIYAMDIDENSIDLYFYVTIEDIDIEIYDPIPWESYSITVELEDIEDDLTITDKDLVEQIKASLNNKDELENLLTEAFEKHYIHHADEDNFRRKTFY